MNPLPAKSAAARAYCNFNIVNFTIGAEAANVINVALQLQDAHGNNLAEVCHVRAYLSDNANGSTLTVTVTTSVLAIGTNGVLLLIPVTGKMVDLITDASGRVDINIPQTATPTYYLCVMMPDGSIQISGAIAFA